MFAVARIFWIFAVLLGLAAATCYNPNGFANGDAYQPCGNATNGHSMCCSTKGDATPDTCRDDGLCANNFKEPQLWREGCTDPTWQSENCLKLCSEGTKSIWPAPRDAPVDLNATHVLITTCTDGSFCCGGPNSDSARTCCANGEGVRIVNGKVESATPKSTSSSTLPATATTAESSIKSGQLETQLSSPSSQTSSATESTGIPPPTAPPPQTSSGVSTATIAGAVVGGLVGLACILAGVLVLLRRRKNASQPKEVPANELHGEHGFSGKPIIYAMELGTPDPVELASEPVEIGGNPIQPKTAPRNVQGSHV